MSNDERQKKQKIYCFVDETGQDMAGELFLVAVVLKRIGDLENLRKNLAEIENQSGKRQRKWTKTPTPIKQKYLRLLLEYRFLERSVFYSIYRNSKEYTSLLSLTIAKSILFQNMIDYSAAIIVDGLKAAETESVRRELKNLNIHYSKIRGMKDEQDAILRLADSMAGFIRDYKENQEYAKKIFKEFNNARIITEI